MLAKVPKLNHINILGLLSASIIPFLVIGPFFPDLILSVFSLWFIYFTIKNKFFYIYRNIYFYIFLIFCLICLLSSILSDNILLSFESSLFYFRIGVFALFISYLIDKEKKILDYFYYSFLITYSVLIFDGFFQYFVGFNVIGYELYDHDRVSSFFKDELVMGSFLVRLLPLFLALYIIRPDKRNYEKFIFYVIFIFTYLLIYLSGERTAFFFLHLIIFFNIILLQKEKLLRIIIIISIVFGGSLMLSDPKIYDRHILLPLKQFGFNDDRNEKYIFSSGHDSLYRTAWNMFLDKPILGHGPKMFRVLCKEKKYSEGSGPCSTHPHNFYVQLLAETGLVGFSLLFSAFLFLIFSITRHLLGKIIYKKILFSDYQICLLSGIFIALWPLSPNGSFFNNFIMMLYSLQIGFFLESKKILNK